MLLPIHELAALGTALCWATTGVIAADAVRALGPFHFNLLRQLFVALCLAVVVAVTSRWTGLSPAAAITLAVSGVVGILLGDTLNFAAVARIGPRRTGAIFALNAPLAAALGWALLGEALSWQGVLGILVTTAGVALAILGRPRANAHRFEALQGTLLPGIALGLGAAMGQAGGSLIARPVMAAGLDPYLASLVRVGASGLAMGVLASLPAAPALPRSVRPAMLALTMLTALIGLLLGMTLFLYALQGSQTGIISTLSATSPVLILPLMWLRTGQPPTALSALGGAVAVLGLALLFLR